MAPKIAQKLSGTQLVHGDDELVHGKEVAASISVTTSEPLPRYVSVDVLILMHDLQPSELLFPRVTSPST